MVDKSVIKYKYAKNEQEEIVFIEDLENTPSVRKEEFRCISCKNILIPKGSSGFRVINPANT
jgi:uncharacterized protein with PIN domain